MADPNDFELAAFDILDSSKDYNEGVNQLRDLYSSVTPSEEEAPKIKALVSDYGDQLSYKFKEPGLAPENLLDIAPIKPSQVQGADDIEKINAWETQNLAALETQEDADYLISKNQLVRQIGHYASEARRDIKGNRGEGPLAWATDKFFRVAEGSVGGIARLFGDKDTAEALNERTDRKRDEDFSSAVASGAGTLVPLTAGTLAGAAVAGPGGAVVGGLAAVGADITGRTEETYDRYKEVTGDSSKAFKGAAISAAANAVGFIPYGRVLSKSTAKLATRMIGKELLKDIATASVAKVAAVSAGEAAVAGAAGQVLNNVGEAIGNDTEIELNKGVIKAGLVQALLGGTYGAAHTMISRAYETRTQKTVDDIKNPPEEKNWLEKAVDRENKKTTQNKDVQDSTVISSESALARETELYPFEKTSEGEVKYKEVPVTRVEDRIKAIETADKNTLEYINREVPDDGRLRNEVGEEVELPQGENEPTTLENFVANTSTGKPIIVTDSMRHVQPNGRFASWLGGMFGSTTTLKRVIGGGSFGVAKADFDMNTGGLKNPRVEILRSLGADPRHFTSTLAHEIGHIMDYMINPETFIQPALRDIAAKVIGVRNAARSLVDRPELRLQAAEISKAWRPGWDGRTDTAWGKYRGDPAELYADTTSALINAPKWVKESFPEFWNAFEDRLSNDPQTNEAWNHIQSFENDPGKISEFNMNLRREARKEQLVRDVNAKEEAQTGKTVGAKLHQFLAESHKYVFNRLVEAKQVIGRLPDKYKAQGMEILNNLQRKDYVYDFFNRAFDQPLQKMNLALKNAEISLDTFSHYLWSKRVLEESTNTIERIKDNPAPYRVALTLIGEKLKSMPEVHDSLVDQTLHPTKTATTEGLIDAFAQIGIITDAQKVPSLAEIAQKYPLTDPERAKKAQTEYQRIKRQVDSGTHSIPREKLQEWLKGLDPKDPATEILRDVLAPNAFNARKYLVGGGGTTTFDANRDIAHIEKQLGPEKTKILQEQTDAFHKVHAQVIPLMDAAHLLTDEMRDRMNLNSSNYVTANILKFYENSRSIDAGIRASIGSLSEMGNELASTYLKSKAIAERSYVQRATNNMVQLGRLSEYKTTPIEIPYGKNIFDERAVLSSNDPNASYLIEYRDGEPALYHIADGNKSFENMLKNPDRIPVVSALGDILDKFNRALSTRALLTNLSPAFVLNQKFMDRFNEALQSKSWTAPLTMFLPIHASAKLRNFHKESIREVNKFVKTGELPLTGPLKDAVSHDAVLTSLINQTLNGVDPSHTFENHLYAEYGIEPPAVKDIFDKMGETIEKTVRAIPFMDAFSHLAERDEMVTKLNGYKIGIDMGMTKAKAAVFARERFGNPDPLGGGIAATSINKYFLFGRAHFNGLRVLGSTLWENKADPKFMGVAATVVLAKAMTNSSIMQPVINALFGEEEAQKYQAFLDRIPKQEKISRQIVPIGFQDEKGNLHNMMDVKFDEIQPSWKAVYERIPQNRELTNVASVVAPALAGNFSESAVQAANQVTASTQPVIQYLINIGHMLNGENPEDAFRHKAILSKDVQEAGGAQRWIDYGAYVAKRQFGTFIPDNPFATEDKTGPLGVIDKGGKVPVAGKLVHSFLGVTNYGLIENDKSQEATKVAIDAQIRTSTKDSTKYLLEQARYFNAKTVGKKKEEKVKLGARELTRGAILKSWEAKVWHPFRDELRMAKDAENSVAYEHNVDLLETLSKEYQKLLLQNPDIPEKD